MTADIVFNALNFFPPLHWRETWSISEPDYCAGDVFFLKDEFIRNACTALKMDSPLCEVFHKALPLIANNPVLERLAWHCHKLLFTHYREPEFYSWPMLPAELGPAADMFYAVTIVSGLTQVQAIHRQKQISEKITKECLANLTLHMNDHRKKTGNWGLTNITWMIRHFTGRLYRLGRLQFFFDTFRQDFRVFRNIHDRRVLLLAEPGIAFREDGQYDGVNGIYDPRVFTSTLDFKVMPIRGNPVTPDGRVLRQTVQLSFADWIQVLAPGDPTLSLHIPAGGKMDHGQCGESMREASEFFPKHFPERPYRAYTCDSWLLDPHFEKYLPPDANIVRFQREFYLHPVRGQNAGVVGSAFGVPVINPQTAPRDTALRRAVLQYLEGGGL
ncbi:MAG: acyltransferase domain-containing protein, partial [Verrucomicrobiota bacterium]